jgi:outer membrane protein OmpA-like peptidoglycan-associated protein
MKIAGIKIGSIYFDYDKFELKPQEKEELNQLGKFLQANLEKRCPAELLRQQGCAGIEY